VQVWKTRGPKGDEALPGIMTSYIMITSGGSGQGDVHIQGFRAQQGTAEETPSSWAPVQCLVSFRDTTSEPKPHLPWEENPRSRAPDDLRGARDRPIGIFVFRKWLRSGMASVLTNRKLSISEFSEYYGS
jgi:hypothetical protein